MKRMKTMEKIGYVVVGILIVMAFSMLFTVQARSRSAEKMLFDNRAYERSEQAYTDWVKEILDSYGLYHSGLTMTRVVSLDGNREYHLVIYNSRISGLEVQDYLRLESEIGHCAVTLPDGTTADVAVSLTGCEG